MTGFGRSEFQVAARQYRVRVRTVNHKGLDLRCRLPGEFHAFEGELNRLLRERLGRGHVELGVSIEKGFSSGRGTLGVDSEALDSYRSVWETIAGVGTAVDPQWLLAQDGVMQFTPQELDEGSLKSGLFQAVQEALDAVVESRGREGAALAEELRERLRILGEIVEKIGAEVPQLIADHQQALRERLEAVSSNPGLEPGWVEHELVLVADRMDVQEEVARLRAHLEQMRAILDSNESEPQGKRLGFLATELMREATTVASKAGNSQVSAFSVDARCEVERIREQIMNVE